MKNTIELRIHPGAAARVEPVVAPLTDEQRAALGRAPWDLEAIATLSRWGYDVLVRCEQSASLSARESAPLDVDEALRTLDPALFYALGAKFSRRAAAPQAAQALAIAMALSEDEVQQFLDRCESWRFLGGSSAVSAVLRSGERARLEPSKKRVKRAEELWELFAARGVIPMEFTEAPRFTSDRTMATSAPSSLQMAVRIACNPSLVTRIDALAKEFASRGARMGVAHVERVLWLDPAPDLFTGWGYSVRPNWCGALASVLHANEPRARRALAEFARGSGKRWCTIVDAVCYALAASTGIAMTSTLDPWCESVCKALGVEPNLDWPRDDRAPEGLIGEPLDPARNPFVATVQIELEGVVIEQITQGSVIAFFAKE